MAVTELITRDEFTTVISRLDAADQHLQDGMLELERELRHDYEGKIEKAVEGVKEDIKDVRKEVQDSRVDIKADVKDVKEGLTLQNRTALGLVMITTLTALMYLGLHFWAHAL